MEIYVNFDTFANRILVVIVFSMLFSHIICCHEQDIIFSTACRTNRTHN